MFKIPTPILPTKEEIIARSLRWWEEHKEINQADWNEELTKNSIPFRLVYVGDELTELTVQAFDTRKMDAELIERFEALLSPYLQELNCKNRFFYKLITRSAKDYLSDEKGVVKAVTNTKDFFYSLISSIRCGEDLCLLCNIEKFIIVVKPFIEIDPKTEWRVYIKDKKINGISQYFYNQKFDYKKIEIRNAKTHIKKFINNIVIPNVDKSDFVADVIFDGKATLIELNPYWLSDPCLFYSYDNMKGEFLFN